MLLKHPILKQILLWLCMVLFGQHAFGSDSINTNLSFDFGVTRGRNINLWPVFKRFKNEEQKELQIIYPLFSKTSNDLDASKHLQVVPFYVADSSATKIDKRYLTLYFPSLYHYNKSLNDSITTRRFVELAPYVSLFGLSRTPAGMSVENNLLFFIWFKRSAYSNVSKLTVFPIYWYTEDDWHRSHLLFPIYFHRSSYERIYTHINELFVKGGKRKLNSKPKDFLLTPPPAGTQFIISNPPWSLKTEIFQKLFELNLPFAYSLDYLNTQTDIFEVHTKY